jgi:hypothetical protein
MSIGLQSATGLPASGTITNAKLADMAQSTLKGRTAAAGTGVPVDLTVAQAQTILGLVGTTVDNTVIRANGTSGGTQGSSVTIDDSDNIATPGTIQSDASQGILRATVNGSTTAKVELRTSTTTSAVLEHFSATSAQLDINALAADGTSGAAVRLFRSTNTAGAVTFSILRGNNSATADHVFTANGGYLAGAATGGDKGLGAINAKDVYNDNVALTCMALDAEYQRTGTIDLEYWHSLVPDTVIPAVVEEAYVAKVPVTRSVERQRIEEADDGFVLRTVTVEEPVTMATGVWDEDGNGVGAIEVPLFDEVEVPANITPEVIIPRDHAVARIFKDMIDDGFDPRDPVKYIARLRSDQALPGMPTRDTWEHNAIGQGELFSRLWLALEMLANVVVNHEERLQKLGV